MELESKGYENANGKTCKYNLTHSLADITLAQATPIPSRDCLTLDRIPLKHTLPYQLYNSNPLDTCIHINKQTKVFLL